MSCAADSESAGPVVELLPKRSYDDVLVSFDWHDFLANLPERGRQVSLAAKVRLPRARSTGLQYECTTAGVTGAVEPRWPTSVDATIQDGSVVWTAKAVDSASMRTTVSSNEIPEVAGLDIGDVSVADFVYSAVVGGGESGTTYDITHRIVCANDEEKEAVGKLLVQD